MGLFIVSSSLSKPSISDCLDFFWPVDREASPKYSVVETSSSCFKSHNRRPMTCPQRRFPQIEMFSGIGVPAMAALIALDTETPRAFRIIRDLKAAHAYAEGASHRASMHGSLGGSSLTSTAPRRLVRVHKLQSYSNDAHAIRVSFSLDAQECHSSSKLAWLVGME